MMTKEEKLKPAAMAGIIDYAAAPVDQQKVEDGETSSGGGEDNNSSTQQLHMVDYMLNHPSQPSNNNIIYGSSSFDKFSFADVMQFADFGPKLALMNQSRTSEEDSSSGIDPVYFLKFPVLNDGEYCEDSNSKTIIKLDERDNNDEAANTNYYRGGGSENAGGVQLQSPPPAAFLTGTKTANKRKRPRTVKTSEEVESQRMTHIAVERNRRKQMNEHLRVLRSLMPGSYVQRGDQASIIGGAIEFVRELEQLLQCLESQKRRRLYGDGPRPSIGDSSSSGIAMQQPPPQAPFMFPADDDQTTGLQLLQEENAESKSCLADVEVKLLGYDGMIKILCRRRHGQVIKTIAALEDMQLNILHTNITTIEQTVLYTFNVKVGGGARYTAEDIATSVQQILSFIHADTNNI